jgi:hypothetical protein
MNYFTHDEVKCKCGNCDGSDIPDPKLLFMMNMTRFYIGIPLYVNSCIRCKLHPLYSDNHEKYAVDFRCIDSKMRGDLLIAMRRAGFKRIGIDKIFIHGDITPNKERSTWLY